MVSTLRLLSIVTAKTVTAYVNNVLQIAQLDSASMSHCSLNHVWKQSTILDAVMLTTYSMAIYRKLAVLWPPHHRRNSRTLQLRQRHHPCHVLGRFSRQDGSQWNCNEAPEATLYDSTNGRIMARRACQGRSW
jgi:hypothetical protein